jgi:hypothetical protein
MSSCAGALFWRSQGRYRLKSNAGVRAVCSTNHSLRAAAKRSRNVLAPTTRSRLRQWSWPNPAQALPSRMGIAPAHRSRYGARMAARRSVRSGVKTAATRGKGWRWPGLRVRNCRGRRTPTTPSRCPGNTVCHSPVPAWTSAPASGGWGCQPDRLPAQGCGDPSQPPVFGGQPRRGGVRGGGAESLPVMSLRETTATIAGNCGRVSLVA